MAKANKPDLLPDPEHELNPDVYRAPQPAAPEPEPAAPDEEEAAEPENGEPDGGI